MSVYIEPHKDEPDLIRKSRNQTRQCCRKYIDKQPQGRKQPRPQKMAISLSIGPQLIIPEVTGPEINVPDHDLMN